MKRNHETFRLASAASLRLAAGRAPVCWRSELGRRASQAGRLRHACDWVGPLARMAARLRDKPLFGDCLAELVEAADAGDGGDARQNQTRRAPKPQATPSPISKSNRSRRRLTRPGDPAECSSGNVGQDAISFHQAPPVCPTEVTELPHRASRDLIEICAEKQERIPSQHSRAACELPASATPQSPPHPAIGPQIECEENAQSQLKAAQRKTDAGSGAEEFAKRIARRAVNSLRCLQPSPTVETQESDLLGEQWSTPLDGTTVSGGLLEQIMAGEPSATKAGRSIEQIVAGKPGATKAGKPGQLPEPASHSTSGATQQPEESPAIGVRRTIWSPSHEQDHAPPPDPFDDLSGHAPRDTEANRAGVERIAPPALAPSLPPLSPLTPAPQTAASGVLPLASETARQGAREEATPAEDLDALAAKIKFILDEQARRHGIDV